MTNFDQGVVLYLNGIACHSLAAAMATNPALKMIARVLATSCGTMLSSPSAIQAGADNCDAMGNDVVAAGKSHRAAFNSVGKEDWEKMGRAEADATSSAFEKEASEVKLVFDALKGIMSTLSGHSWAGGVASSASGLIMVGLVMASNAGWFLGPGKAAVEVGTLASGNSLLATVRGVVAKNAMVYATAAGMAMALQNMLAQHSMTAMDRAAHPTEKVPQFEQVYIPDLPTTDKKGKPLGEA
ncbi:hypothetical protein [Nonomuraea rhodomycinica]|uniref:Uncharacterized protein n=1 Tax=Nonomuraea rhodomycinica TaxID=1712872 RepID=A0A7Y6IND8_9ACTN|nr:hypothetical protein [Nonomuraea rhodomycinica]NUW40958.1 hypothetical protein [Nonomuraea rhodomycinica]